MRQFYVIRLTNYEVENNNLTKLPQFAHTAQIGAVFNQLVIITKFKNTLVYVQITDVTENYQHVPLIKHVLHR